MISTINPGCGATTARGKDLAKIEIYDTSLRDGEQSEDIAFSLDDKCLIAQKMDAIGIDYIEAGWPGANPKATELFARLQQQNFKRAKLMAFGSTCRADSLPENDKLTNAIIAARPDGATIFGKSWDVHVNGPGGLGCTLEENLKIITATVAYLKQNLQQVFFDAEHFFDGFKHNRDYAIAALKAASQGGAERLILCDTNGGSLPHEITAIVSELRTIIDAPLGIHCHNDGELAVANSLCAVQAGVVQVQGTVNGVGERCGNANLCSIVPNLVLKLGYECSLSSNLGKLTEASRVFDDIANLSHNKHAAFVGEAAFAHKGGVHASAVLNDPLTYEHITPESVGNQRRILVSEQAGRSNILHKAKEFNIDLSKDQASAGEIVKTIKDLESCGYQFEGADASLELLMQKALGQHTRNFKLKGFRVITEKRSEDTEPISEATIMIEVDGNIEHTAALGNGPVNALDSALRKALEKFYPSIHDVNLLDFKVRVISSRTGTGSVVRVLIESGDKHDQWNTVGVSANLIEASWIALVDSLDYKLYKDRKASQA